VISTGIPDDALLVPHRLADCAVVQPEFRERLAGCELVVAEHEVAFRWCRVLRGMRRRRGGENGRRSEAEKEFII
jgi:hypothetical protein